jgi:hypothetical protein
MTEQEFKLFKQLAVKFEQYLPGLHINVEVTDDGSVEDIFSLTECVDSLAELSDYIAAE